MDEGYTKSVLTAFVELYNKGLIYKGHRLVNWCPVSKSAISDEEVIHREKNGSLWYFRYNIKGSDEYVVVATTRPETMFGDTAVAVNPNDMRYKHLTGKKILLPIVGREIPIIFDDYVDPDFGTGCVKITPAHDPNDFLIYKNHDLDIINIMNDDATLNQNVPEAYIGLSREEGREKVIKDIKELGLLHKTDDYLNKVGYSERGGVPIESYLSDQWFMKMDALAKPAINAVKDKKIQFHPNHWTKTYNHWMENIKDWCISRQLWWGHQIPVWYLKKDKSIMHVSVEGPSDVENWVQESDVLDTWASSWLWPIAVHTWPKESKSLNKFYPTNTLVTGPDIIFFWVARMIITGYEFQKELPFKDVYFTSILRDKTGKKLSKSLGNSPDPFDLFEKFGTDAVRFGVMLMSPQGSDVLFSEDRLEIGRNFMNKLWNACRFVDMNIPEDWDYKTEILESNLNISEKWILSRLTKTIENYNHQLDRFHFNEAAKVLYEFTWNDFCDWYVEIAKLSFYGGDLQKANNARSVSIKCLQTILKLLHPYAPFITEELWQNFKPKSASDLIITQWPSPITYHNDIIELEISSLKNIITAIRAVRSRMNIPNSKPINLYVKCDKEKENFLSRQMHLLKNFTVAEEVFIDPDTKKPTNSATVISNGIEFYIPLSGLVDLEKEKKRMKKRLQEIEKLLISISGKLSNQNFLDRAPEEVISREKYNQSMLTEEKEKLLANLEIFE
jgi:valyl-tRNA synthetase